MSSREKLIYLGGEKISIGGAIEKVSCSNCNFTSKRLVLHSDTDMVYVGVVGLTDQKTDRILITHLSDEEWDNYSDQVPEKLEQRINNLFKSSSFIYYDQKHFTDKVSKMSIYRPICPKCSDYMEKNGTQSFGQYISSGGKIISMDIYD